MNFDLCYCIRIGDLNTIRILFAKHSKDAIDKQWKRENFDFLSPIHEAAEYGHTHILKYLLSDAIDFDINELTSHGSHIVHLAAYFGKVSTLKFILNEYRICPEIVTSETKCSSLHLAARNGHKNVVQTLAETYNVNIDKVDGSGSTALHRASGWKQLHIIDYLIRNQSANMEIQRDDDGFTCLMLAAYYNKYESVQMLLDFSANIDALSFEECTPAHIAMERNNYKSLYYLICRGANIDFVCKECTVRNMAAFGNFELRQCVKNGLKEYQIFYEAVLVELNKEFNHLFGSDVIAEIMDATYPKIKKSKQKKRKINVMMDASIQQSKKQRLD